MSGQSNKIKSILIIYWVLLIYVISALVWWYVALSRQNEQMTALKLNELKYHQTDYNVQVSKIIDAKKRKTAQYVGEGSIFLLLILAGAIFLFRAVKKQLQLTQQQRNFMMAITHELKTPIAVTRLNLETLQKRKLEESQQQKLISNTLSEAGRMDALCNNLLLSAQMESQVYHVTMESQNMAILVRNCIKDYSLRFSDRSFKEKTEETIFVSGDLFLLQMALGNLIENAVKYSPADSTITVTLSSKRNTCLIEIADEGCGIAEAEKEKVFEKFYRAGNDATQASKGTGLGLYLVSRIIQAHQGTVYIKDNHPKGTVLVIALQQLTT